ncbi:hypothetical protein BHE74_00026716 [Ensete ventricosum]|nr:hypothetical protein GW17_00041130 [Ensete ventricosum]RWW65948.1 hypothetical protein BHE74_00026716 [Ensete ventricosum]
MHWPTFLALDASRNLLHLSVHPFTTKMSNSRRQNTPGKMTCLQPHKKRTYEARRRIMSSRGVGEEETMETQISTKMSRGSESMSIAIVVMAIFPFGIKRELTYVQRGQRTCNVRLCATGGVYVCIETPNPIGSWHLRSNLDLE